MRVSLILRIPIYALILAHGLIHAEESYPPHPDSVVQDGVPKGELVKGTFIAGKSSVFPGTEREYQIYLPAGFGPSKPTPFMVFQDGVLYNAPAVFDNLIAKKEIPPLVGIFIKPGVVPASNPEALPRFNRSYEYDSVTDTYSKFLIDEFLPAIEAKHGLKLSADPNDAAICGNSSGGICAFMAAWHRPDRFRRIFSGVGTYVGIRGADQLPVLIRKTEPKPLRVYLQSGEQDNNLYCGDWWMANQMMERSLTWAGYDVNHTWGTGGHNQKQATAIFPDVLKWLWRDYFMAKEIKMNPRGDSKWRGYEVLGERSWKQITISDSNTESLSDDEKKEVMSISATRLAAAQSGDVYFFKSRAAYIFVIPAGDEARLISKRLQVEFIHQLAVDQDGRLNVLYSRPPEGEEALGILKTDGSIEKKYDHLRSKAFALNHNKKTFLAVESEPSWLGDPLPSMMALQNGEPAQMFFDGDTGKYSSIIGLCLSPDQSLLYGVDDSGTRIWSIRAEYDRKKTLDEDPFMGSEDKWETALSNAQPFYDLQSFACTLPEAKGLCVDTEGRLYVATSLGIQVCDQAGRVNFIIPTPQQPYDICFGGKDLGELFIACGDKIYKRETKVHGYISGQMAPIKPAPPKL